MAEQSSLDGNWKTSWRLMGLENPPWADWNAMDSNSVKRDFSKSRLADNQWLAAVIADMKDEDFLMKRRGKGGGKSDDKKD